ncbi:MAG: hypothetical protein G01um10148_782 [Parcubacteria group bacterium Gr01-1014_8]|nr:MAG: hypothetical protein G01um10148_782 [Parcubacteria group bacterium Gr01-1014_8]
MEKSYAQALWNCVERGMEPAHAVRSLHQGLERRGRASLWPQIARAFERLASRESQKNRSVLIVADKSHEKEARKESDAEDARLVVDTGLIGGWRFENNEQLIDASFKKNLLELYQRSTNGMHSAGYQQ